MQTGSKLNIEKYVTFFNDKKTNTKFRTLTIATKSTHQQLFGKHN